MIILTVPKFEEFLKQKTAEVADFSSMPELAANMLETAKENNLVGLAANQVGILQRVFVADMGYTGRKSDVPNWVVFINPIVKGVKDGGRSSSPEGCASIPSTQCVVERWNRVVIEAQDENGEYFNMVLKGSRARAVQHELDHLNGVLITSKSKGTRRF